jgi:enoyl-CoA hydratase/carnithine racemase
MAVHYELSDHIALITIDRQEALNSIDLDTWSAFGEATARLEADDDAWVGIITGAGERAFCAGADIKTTIRRLMDDPRGNPYDQPATIMRGQSPTKPLIAAVNGHALGGGLEVLLACDIRIASKAARIGAPEVGLGLIPGWGGTQRLPRQVPWAIAAQMNLGGDPISADDALRFGLVNAVVEPADVLPTAREWAAKLCTRGPVALRAAKRAMVEGQDLTLDLGLALEAELFDSLAYTEDVQEGIAAFEARRPPEFKGR